MVLRANTLSPRCVLARGCDSCTHESELSESELADMGCVLARSCDSCAHESGFSESEVADMGCVLARSCDSCTHEPWFCGLKFGDEVGRGDSSSLETRFVNDPSRDLCASVPMKIVLVRAHDWFDDHSEVAVEQQVEPYLKFLRPLLSQVADNTDASWWLLDSGASTSVWAESNLSAFRSVLQDSEGLGGYRAANGSLVNMSGTAEIGVQMHMSGPSGDDWCWKKITLCQLLHWQIRDGDSHKVQKVLICFTKGLECILGGAALLITSCYTCHGYRSSYCITYSWTY